MNPRQIWAREKTWQHVEEEVVVQGGKEACGRELLNSTAQIDRQTKQMLDKERKLWGIKFFRALNNKIGISDN